MLNNLFHKGEAAGSGGDGAGFANGVRASAGLVAGMQLVAGLLMRARYERAGSEVGKSSAISGGDGRPTLWTAIGKFSRDAAYVALVTGFVSLCRLS